MEVGLESGLVVRRMIWRVLRLKVVGMSWKACLGEYGRQVFPDLRVDQIVYIRPGYLRSK